MPKCKYCGATIKYIKMITGSWMPVLPEAKRLFKGNDVKMITSYGQVISCSLFGQPEDYLCIGFEQHWPKCPGADKARKPKPEKQEEINLFGSK